MFGHDWRRAIAPKEGYYLRCRRCWVSREPDQVAEQSESPSWGPPHHQHSVESGHTHAAA